MSDEEYERLELQGLLATIDPAARRALSDEWSTVATDTYAGVARFAQFALELLAVAAPPRLLEAANRAALDELARARSCFALASIFAGRDVGVQPLPLSSLPTAKFDLVSATERVVRQGCVDETLARAELELVRTRPLPSAVARVNALLLAGAVEKLELAYGFLAFALAENAALVRPAAERAFEHALGHRRDEAVKASAVPDAILRTHGRLTREERIQLRAELALCVRPAADTALRGG